MKLFSLIWLTILLTPQVFSKTLNVVAINSGANKEVTASLLREYESKHSGVEVNFTAMSDGEFKDQLATWVSESTPSYDVIFWQGGKRLFQFTEQNQVKPLSELLPNSKLEASFTEGSLGAVKFNNAIYAIPLSYYQWGIYYRRSTFSNINLSPPKTWQELLQVGEALKKQGIAPFALGNQNQWPSSAWFDYLNLRINGLQYHSELLNGQHSFLSPEVTEVFAHWKTLVSKNFILKHHQALDWNEALPFLYHRYASMVLIGNFAVGEIPKELKSDFGFIPFPTINSSVGRFEDAPLDVIMVPANVTNSPELREFASYLASEDFQTRFNQDVGLISPHKNATLSDDPFLQAGSALLSNANGVAQFFDRDTKQAFVGPALEVFSEFISTGDSNKAQASLEKLRQAHLIN